MMAEYWWRSWHGAPMDHKWAVIAARTGVKTGVVAAIAWALFDYASQQDERGSVEGFDPEEYAVYSGFSEEEIKSVIATMETKGIIAGGRLAKWEKRQPKSEAAIERATKSRSAATLREVAADCGKLREVAADCGKLREVAKSCIDSDTDSDTDTEAEAEAEQARANANDWQHSQEWGIPEPQNEEAATAATPGYIPPSREEHIYCAVTNHPTIPSGEIDSVLDRIAKIQKAKGYGSNEIIEYLRPFWRAQKARYPGSTRSFWLDWAVIGEIPTPAVRDKPKTRTVTDARGNTLEVPL